MCKFFPDTKHAIPEFELQLEHFELHAVACYSIGPCCLDICLHVAESVLWSNLLSGNAMHAVHNVLLANVICPLVFRLSMRSSVI